MVPEAGDDLPASVQVDEVGVAPEERAELRRVIDVVLLDRREVVGGKGPWVRVPEREGRGWDRAQRRNPGWIARDPGAGWASAGARRTS